MARLFGLDIDRIVNDSITSAGGMRPVTLYRAGEQVQDANDLTRYSVAETAYTGQGYVRQMTGRDPITKQPLTESRVHILGASMAVVPAVNDKVEIDGCSYVLTRLVNADPAGAMYVFASSQ